MKQYGKYFAGLIALYIVVANGSQSGQVFSAGASGIRQITTGLQGRTNA